jgi:hypothetical protein
MGIELGKSPQSALDSNNQREKPSDEQLGRGGRRLWSTFVVLLVALCLTTLLGSSSQENSFYKLREGLRSYFLDNGPPTQARHTPELSNELRHSCGSSRQPGYD